MKCSPRQAGAVWSLVWLLAIPVLLGGCANGREVEATLGLSPVPSAVPHEELDSTAAPGPTAGPVSLVILHTNDNWGETEPCG